MTEPLLPVTKPLLVCRDVLVDANQDNVHVLGVFNAIRPQSQSPFPHRHPLFGAFVQLSDTEGEVPAYLQVVEANTQSVIARTAIHRLVFPHRRFLLRTLFRLEDCTFPRPGVYWVEFYGHACIVTDQVLHLREPGE
jgi:hypothetical protein